MKIKKVFKDIENYLEANISSYNSGGCGVIALYMGRELLKRGIDFKFHCCDPDITIINKKRIWTSYYHIWIQIEGISFNKGNFSKTHIYDKSHIDQLKYNSIYRRNGNWNDYYSIENNDRIRRAIKYYFKKYGM